MKLLHALTAAALLAVSSPSQDPYSDFVKAFDAARGISSEEQVDRAVKGHPESAVYHFLVLCEDAQYRRDQAASEARDVLLGSWTRAFRDNTILDRIQRFVERQTEQRANNISQLRQSLVTIRTRFDNAKLATNRTAYEIVRDEALQLSRSFEEYGDNVHAADTWELVATINHAMPGKTRQDRLEVVSALRRFVELRSNWGWTQDQRYKVNVDLLKTESAALEEAQAQAEARAEAGYAADVVGVDALVMPDAEEEFFELDFAPLRDMEPDFWIKGGELTLMWPSIALVGDIRQQMPIFKKTQLFLARPKHNEFTVTYDGGLDPDPRSVTEVDASPRPRPTEFFLAEGRTDPYAMWFFVGSDRERYMMADMNMAPTRDRAEVFFRSAASWRASIKGETVTFYDDNCDGLLFSEDPYAHGTRLRGLGEVTDTGIAVPAYDSMRIGSRGRRIPFSSLTKIDDTWYNLRGEGDSRKVGVRPLNPEFFKTGHVQLVWEGNRRTTPQVLVIQGLNEMSSVAFDIASGDPVEVPVGEYEIGFGRIVAGRGGRTLMAHIFKGDSPSFIVEDGGTFELAMGEPFHIDFQREGSGTRVQIDSTKMRVLDQSGAVYTYLHGGVLEAEVVASRRPDGRGARPVGEFVPLKSGEDPMVNSLPLLGREALAFPKAKGGVAARGGRGGGGGMQMGPGGRMGNVAPGAMRGGMGRARSSPVLTIELDDESMVVGIRQLKHPLFGDLEPVFK